MGLYSKGVGELEVIVDVLIGVYAVKLYQVFNYRFCLSQMIE
jgi:hypothetical protein